MSEIKEIRKLSFEELKEILRDPFRVIVEEGNATHICEYGQETYKVLERVSLSSEAHELIKHLSTNNIIYKSKWGRNIVSDIPDFATFYDIHRGDIYGNQTDDEYEIAASLELAEAR